MLIRIKNLIMVLGLSAAMSSAYASVVLSNTRVIYPGDEQEVTVKLTNENAYPALVQAWIDNGEVARGEVKPDPDAKSQKKVAVPFLLTPPLFRLEPKKGHALRLVYTGEPLPRDRESLFWLNVLDVPPIEKASAGSAAQRNSLRIAFRTSVKLLFRPSNLAGNSADAPNLVTWRWTNEDKELSESSVTLEAMNPTPYYLSFSKVSVVIAGVEYHSDDKGMVDPFGKASFAFKNLPQNTKLGAFNVNYSTVNDYGGTTVGTFKAGSTK